jgi:hypothetical protein
MRGKERKEEKISSFFRNFRHLGTDVMILKIVLPKNNRRKNGVLDSKHC